MTRSGAFVAGPAGGNWPDGATRLPETKRRKRIAARSTRADDYSSFPVGTRVPGPRQPGLSAVGSRPMLYWIVKGVLTPILDRKSTRLNSSHVKNSYAVFCLKK